MIKKHMNSSPRRLPLDIATFKVLREENYLYVDKTQHAYNLITGGRRFFLSRPRRFGKSLFVSMLQEVLVGSRDLFKELWIDQSDYSWLPHGVIALDLSSLDVTTPHELTLGIADRLDEIVQTYDLGVVLDRVSAGLDLRKVVVALHRRFGRVAILIDEYDSLVLRSLNNQEKAEQMRDALHRFFSAIKGLDAYINFVFITGVSSFAKAGIFSGMNNLQILTLQESCVDICGYTDAEVDTCLSTYIQAWADKIPVSFAEQRQKIKDWYNGYRFSSTATTVYNPFSLMYALDRQKLENFWFSSGTPKFLVGELKKKQQDNPELFNAIVEGNPIEASQSSLGVFDIGLTPIPALMFQTGYLTIVGYNERRNSYQLGYPNYEVQQALQLYLLSIITTLDNEATESMATKLIIALEKKDISSAIQVIKQLFSHVPYQLYGTQEKHYHAILQMIFTVAGLASHAEFSTSHGRIDMVVDLSSIIYVIEVKLNESAAKALDQIEERKYYERFLHKNKTIMLLGIAFKRDAGSFDIEYEERELAS